MHFLYSLICSCVPSAHLSCSSWVHVLHLCRSHFQHPGCSSMSIAQPVHFCVYALISDPRVSCLFAWITQCQRIGVVPQQCSVDVGAPLPRQGRCVRAVGRQPIRAWPFGWFAEEASSRWLRFVLVTVESNTRKQFTWRMIKWMNNSCAPSSCSLAEN